MAPWPAGRKGWGFLWFWGEVGSGEMESSRAVSDTESKSWLEHNKRPEHYRLFYNSLQLGRHSSFGTMVHCAHIFLYLI